MSHPGPLTLIEGELASGDLEFAARIAARFSSGRSEPYVEMKCVNVGGDTQTMQVVPLPASEVDKAWYL